MKDLLLVLMILLSSEGVQASCSTWDILGGAYPERVDGKAATFQEMVDARTATLTYIKRLERTIRNCRMAEFQYNDLVEDMQLVADRFNEQLAIFKQIRQAHQALAD